MPRKLIIKGPKEGGISPSREKYDRMLNPRKSIAYLILSDKPYDYPRRSSRIIYIGQTTKKNERPFTSLTERARRIFKKHPKAEELTVHYVETGKRRGRTLISEEFESPS
jgi:hypothetical protein